MRTHIDWLTFTMTPRYSEEAGEYTYTTAIENAFADMFGVMKGAIFEGEWEIAGSSRAPYKDAWKMNGGEITLFAHPDLTHCCVEISGKGCETIIANGYMRELLEIVRDRVTRIDIASDMETQATPREFTANLSHERMRSNGYQTSETGETCYIGSQKSDRYARVYRYNPPHPRSHLLRAECVFRRDYAKAVCNSCATEGEAAVAQAMGKAFGFNHIDWKPDMDRTVDISITYPERKMGGTVFWLVKQVAPAFKRLVNDGTIKDPNMFFQTYFLDGDS